MRAERTNFVRRLAAITNACDEPLLVNTAEIGHNERATQLRNGLCVRLFSALEDLIRERIARALENLVPASIPFDRLPTKFRTAASLGALQSLAFQAQFLSEDRRMPLLAAEFRKLASVSDPHYSVSRYAFSNSKTNVQATEIFDALDAFMVEKPWETLHHTAKRLQLATVGPLKIEFEQLSEKRNAAAHVPDFDIPSLDLRTRINSAFAIGLAFDIVLTCATVNLNTCLAKHRQLQPLKSSDINLYTLAHTPFRNRFRVLKLRESASPNTAHSAETLADAKIAGIDLATKAVGALIITDEGGKAIEWHCQY